MKTIYIWMAVSVIIIIYIIVNSARKRAIEKENDRKESYKEFPAIPAGRIININNKNSYFDIFNNHNILYNLWVKKQHYNELKKIINKKIALSTKWQFDNLEELKNKKNEIEKENKVILNEIYYFGENTEIPELNKFEEYLNEIIGNKFANLLFGDSVKGFSNAYGSVVAYSGLIIFLSGDNKVIKVYEYNDLEIETQFKYYNSRYYNKNDEVVESFWKYSKKDGGRDMRYSNNYETYKIRKTIINFDLIKEIKKEINLIKDVNSIINRFNSYKSMHKNIEVNYNNNETITTDLGKYVSHPSFGYGKVEKTLDQKLHVNFNGEIKIISQSFKDLKYISNDEYLKQDKHKSTKINSNITLIEDKNIVRKTTSIGDVINHPIFGYSSISNITDDLIKIECIDGNSRSIKSITATKYIVNNKIKYTKKELKLGDYIYNNLFGYGKILGVFSNSIKVLWIHKKQKNLEIYEENFNMFELIKNEKELKNLSLKIGDTINLTREYSRIDFGIIQKFNKKNIYCINLLNNNRESFDFYEINNDLSKFSKWIDSYRNILSHDAILSSKGNKDYYNKKEYKEITDDIKLEYPALGNGIKYNFKSYKLIKNINSIYLNTRFDNFEDYLIYKMYENNVYKYDYDLESQSYNYLLDKICKNKMAIKFNNDTYITIKSFNENGITRKKLEEIGDQILIYLEENGFITVSRIKKLIDPEILRILPDDDTIINFISSFDEFRKYKIGGKDTIVIKSRSLKAEYFEETVREFMNNEEISEIDVDDFIRILNDAYDFEYDFDTFVKEAKVFEKLYYSEEMEKIYINKNEYYREVFGNGI